MSDIDAIAARLRAWPEAMGWEIHSLLDERDLLRAVLRDIVNGEYDGQFGSDALYRRARAALEGK